jgi:endonuclease/exonuclease/phosphatase family metal-dependent hydrolase
MAAGKITTFNMDNTACLGKQQSDLLSIINTVSPDIIVVQEADKTKLKSIIPSTWRTSQDTSTTARMDTAVLWKDSVFSLNSTVNVQVLRAEAGGTDQKARWAQVVSLANKTGGRVTRVVSVNFPDRPSRIIRVMQTPMARNVARLSNKYKSANFVIAGDFNFDMASDPYNLSGRTGLGRAYVGRQGFYLTDTLTATGLSEYSRTNSDHNGVTANITI